MEGFNELVRKYTDPMAPKWDGSMEDLVRKYKETEDDELLQALWNMLVKTIASKAVSFYRSMSMLHVYIGFDVDDLMISAYPALMKALTNRDDKQTYWSNCAFYTYYVKFYLKSAFQRVAGIRIKKNAGVVMTKDALNRSGSANVPVSEDSETELYDTFPDDAADVEAKITDEIFHSELREKMKMALDSLSEQERDVLYAYYYKNETIVTISEKVGLSKTRIGKIRCKACTELRRNAKKYELDHFYEYLRADHKIDIFENEVDRRTLFFKGVGVGRFQQTSISSVEKLIFEREKIRKQVAKEYQKEQKRKNLSAIQLAALRVGGRN